MGVKVPKLKGALFESAVIQRYRTRESSVEEALMEMYFSGVSTRQVGSISERLWGNRIPPQTLNNDLKRVYEDIGEWRNRLLERDFPYVFMDGIWLRRNWGQEAGERQRAGRDQRRRRRPARGHRHSRRDEGGHGKLGGLHPPDDWPQPFRRAADGRRPQPGAGASRRRTAPAGPLPAVHGPLRTQRPLQDAPPEAQDVGRQAQGRVRHGGPGQERWPRPSRSPRNWTA